jgi:hypothetical protein
MKRVLLGGLVLLALCFASCASDDYGRDPTFPHEGYPIGPYDDPGPSDWIEGPGGFGVGR